MRDMVGVYIPSSLPEKEVLRREGITRDEVKRAVRQYVAENNLRFSLIFGLNKEGVLCSLLPDWNPAHPEAFSAFELVPWRALRPYYPDSRHNA